MPMKIAFRGGQSAKAGIRQKAPRAGLALIDMQRDFGSRKWASGQYRSICGLAMTAARAGAPIYLVRHVGGYESHFDRNLMAIAGKGGKLVIKWEGDGSDGILSEAGKDGVGTLVVAGFHAFDCVLKTAKRLLEAGLQVATSERILIGYEDASAYGRLFYEKTPGMLMYPSVSDLEKVFKG